MKKITTAILLLAASACSRAPRQAAKITHFAAMPSLVPSGMTGQLCYGVVNSNRLELTPRVEELLPEEARCFDIHPKADTAYTLVAFGEDGSTDKKSILVKVGPAAPRVADLMANPEQVRRGQQVRVCFQATGYKSLRAHPGKLNADHTCLTDRPKKTTTYTVTALGANREEDTGTVTVTVLR
jgi:hypothetical protein